MAMYFSRERDAIWFCIILENCIALLTMVRFMIETRMKREAEAGFEWVPKEKSDITSLTNVDTVARSERLKRMATKWILLLVILGSGAFISSFVAFVTIRNYERDLLHSQYNALSDLLINHVVTEFQNIDTTLEALAAGMSGRRPWNTLSADGNRIPNYSYERFRNVTNGLLGVTGNKVRAFTYSPWVRTPEQRAVVENFFKDPAVQAGYLLDTEFQPDFNARLTNIGIYFRNGTGGIVRVPDQSYYDPQLMPYVYVSPFNRDESNWAVIGFDISSEPERRSAALRSAAARTPQSSGIIRLLPDVDQGIDTAGGVTCAAVFPWYSDEEKYGTGDADSDLSIPPEATVCAAFNWRVLMGGVLPESAKGFVFIVTAQRQQQNATSYTFRVAGAAVEDVAPTRIYDESLEKYRRQYTIVKGNVTFVLETVPSKQFIRIYMTKTPRDLCIIVLSFTIVTCVVFFSYDLWTQRQAKKLAQVAHGAFHVLDDVMPKHIGRRVVGEHLIAQNNAEKHNCGTPPHSAQTTRTGEPLSLGDRESTGRSRRSSNHDRCVSGAGEAGPAGRGSLQEGEASSRSQGLVRRRSIELNLPWLMNLGQKKPSDGGRSWELSNSALAIKEEIPKTIAELYPQVSVLFFDIVGFTTWSADQEPTSVLILLDTLFGEIDKLTDQYGVYKVDTIGDAWLGVTGCPERSKTHAVDMADFALAVLGQMETVRLKTGIPDLKIRIGINSGPVTAGILRSGKRLKYSIYGDTVNQAARMESNGKPMMIHVSEAFAMALMENAEHRVEERGVIDVKGKGQQRTYFLLSRIPARVVPSMSV